ncbi:MAG: hypothetical protein WCJ09_17065 [Planctomycetota bacterium]
MASSIPPVPMVAGEIAAHAAMFLPVRHASIAEPTIKQANENTNGLVRDAWPLSGTGITAHSTLQIAHQNTQIRASFSIACLDGSD